MIPIRFTGWISSVTYVAALSLWALVSGHWSAWQAARVEVRQEQEARRAEQAPVEQRVVDKLVEETTLGAAELECAAPDRQIGHNERGLALSHFSGTSNRSDQATASHTRRQSAQAAQRTGIDRAWRMTPAPDRAPFAGAMRSMSTSSRRRGRARNPHQQDRTALVDSAVRQPQHARAGCGLTRGLDSGSQH